MEVRVRIPPSPTGNLHLGNAYTFLFNYLFAKKNDGKLILRFEDTDRERNKPEFEQNILDGLTWLGIKWDEGPLKQSERLDSYKKAAERLIEEDSAYYCFCSTEELDVIRKDQQLKGSLQVYSGKCRDISKEEAQKIVEGGESHTIRFKMPDDRGDITWKDLILGVIKFDSKLIGDSVIMRSNGIPLYNFAVIVDDIDMEITHVLRGEDHVSNTPKQIVLFEALGAKLPEFAHWPNILNPDRIGKLSKRENATAVTDYKKEGFLSEAIVNYLALLGWTMPDDKEIMNLEEMEESFDLSKMRKSPAAFDIVKLEWLNGEYIRRMSDEELTNRLQEFLVDHPAKERIAPIVPLIKERIKKLSDFIPLTDFLWEEPEYERQVFERLKIDNLKLALEKVAQTLGVLEKPWDTKAFEEVFRKLAEELELSPSQMFQLIRVAISGQTVTPPLFESIQIIGEEEALKRVKKVVAIV